MKRSSLVLKPIGTIATPHRTKYSAPRQPATASEKSVGIITLNEGSNFEQALEDLQGFDYIWVLFWFHRNANWKPKVLPPHGGRVKRGVLSTRSPHRPNPIGLSLCRLLDVHGREVRVENPDMLDGTPVLDIKPYLPHVESFPDARGGWIQESNEQTAPVFSVSFGTNASHVLDGMKPTERSEVRRYLGDLLSRDPHPHAYRRIKKLKDGTYAVAVRRWRFSYRITGSTVLVFDAAHDARTSRTARART